MGLLRKRDELTSKNERLVKTLKSGQNQLDEIRLQNRDYKRDLGSIKKEIEREKERNIEERKQNEKRENELKRTQTQVQQYNHKIQKKKDEIVSLYDGEAIEDRNTAKLLAMIEQIKESYQGSNSGLRKLQTPTIRGMIVGCVYI